MHKKTIFDNGLVLATYQMKNAHSVAMGIWINVGSRYEEPNVCGISHLLEHMLFKGSKKYSRDKIKQNIEGQGGALNAFTSEELTCYLAKVPSENTFTSLGVLIDMFLYPILKEDDLEREKTVIVEEIRMYKDLPQHMVQEQLDALMWPNHPLGRNIAGSIQAVSSLKKDTLRKFHAKFYTPYKSVVAFAGNVEHEECLAYLKNRLGRGSFEKQESTFERYRGNQDRLMIKETRKDIEQTHLALGLPAYCYTHPNRFVLNLISIILGGNMSSRLFDQIREKHGLAYEISAQNKCFADTGAFYIHAGLDNQKVDLALELIMKELRKLKRVLTPASELNRAKKFYLGQLAMGLDDTLDRMIFMGNSFCSLGKIVDFNWIKKQITKVRPGDLMAVARDIFRQEKINVSLVGPVDDCNQTRHGAIIKDILK